MLCGCAQGNTTTSPVVTGFDPASTEARFRSGGVPETTLAAFCKSPPKTATLEGTEAIKASCRPVVLDKAGDAAVFTKGDGVYHVVFKRPVRNGDICPKGTPAQSICGNFSEGDRMNTSRIDAG
jgi:hypothetical protein